MGVVFRLWFLVVVSLLSSACSGNADMNASNRQSVILDFDPAGLIWTGMDVDDDLAFLVAVALEQLGELDIVGVTVVAGNAPLRHTAANARRLMALAGIGDKPLRLGASWHSMQLPLAFMRALHALSPDIPSSDSAARFIAEETMKRPPGTLSLVTLGPVTNLAGAIAMEPQVAIRLRRVVIMGGELTGAQLDLNFLSDRSSARTVLEAPVEKLLVPIQLCTQVAASRRHILSLERRCCSSTRSDGTADRNVAAAAVAAPPPPPAVVCAHSSKMHLQTHLMPLFVNPGQVRKMVGPWSSLRSQGLADGFIPWDVVAVLVLARPALFHDWRLLAVKAEACEDGGNGQGGREPCGGAMDARELGVEEGGGSGSGGRTAGRGFSGVVRVPYALDEAAVLSAMEELACHVTADEQAWASGAGAMGFGFLPVIAAVVISVVCVVASIKLQLSRARAAAC
jgi:inosine-uridine nucleoside N-ribohydrolase